MKRMMMAVGLAVLAGAAMAQWSGGSQGGWNDNRWDTGWGSPGWGYGPIPFRTLGNGSDSRISRAGVWVIADSFSWESYWRAHTGNRGGYAPDVADFFDDQIVAIHLGAQPLGTVLQIRGIERQDSWTYDVVYSIRRGTPSWGGSRPNDRVGYPFVLLRMPKQTGNIRMRHYDDRNDCYGHQGSSGWGRGGGGAWQLTPDGRLIPLGPDGRPITDPGAGRTTRDRD